jgi:hypothetical protein
VANLVDVESESRTIYTRSLELKFNRSRTGTSTVVILSWSDYGRLGLDQG